MDLTKKILLLFCFLINFSNAHSQTDMRSFIFGHSLLDHRPPLIPTPSDETTVPHWMHLLAIEAGHTYEATGQYGFLPQHANLPPIAQWGYDIVTSPWDSDLEPFSDADFNNILITAGNFMQWQPPNANYPGENISPLSATQDILDWVNTEEPTAKFYIYENWADMAPYINGSFPPTNTELQNYHNYIIGDFHDWWIEYHDSLLLSHPTLEVRMIPVGPILTDLFTNTVLNTIPVTELYEDDAPHGRATTYFLASLITYMATYEEQAPANYSVPSIVHQTVRDNYATVVSHIWNELLAFNLPNGDSRVFFTNALSVDLVDLKGGQKENVIHLNWSTASETENEKFEIEHSIDGQHFQKIGEIVGNGNSVTARQYNFIHKNIRTHNNYYRLKQIDFDGTSEYSTTIYVAFEKSIKSKVKFFPNPTSEGEMILNFEAEEKGNLEIKIFDALGKQVEIRSMAVEEGTNQLQIDNENKGVGIFWVWIFDGRETIMEKIVFN